MEKIAVTRALEKFLKDQLSMGNKVKTILTNENNASIILLEKTIVTLDQDIIKKKYSLDLTPDESGYSVSHGDTEDKISFPAPFNRGNLLYTLSTKMTLSAIVGLMTIISIGALKFWEIQLSNYLESVSLGFLKSYAMNNVSTFIASYLLLQLLVAVMGYGILIVLNLVNKNIVLGNLNKLSKRATLKAWASTFIALFLSWSIFFGSIHIMGQVWFNAHPLLDVLLLVAPCASGSFLLYRELKASAMSTLGAHILLFLFNFISSYAFLFYLFATYNLFHLQVISFKYILIVMSLIPLFVSSIFLASFLKVFPYSEEYSKAKIKKLINNFGPLFCYISFMVIPLILLASSLSKEDSITWSGLGKRQETFIVTPDLQQALTQAQGFAMGKNIKSDLNYNQTNQTITAWVILEVGNKLVVAHSPDAKTEYYFSENPYHLLNIFINGS